MNIVHKNEMLQVPSKKNKTMYENWIIETHKILRREKKNQYEDKYNTNRRQQKNCKKDI